jgi:hypothetical protein
MVMLFAKFSAVWNFPQSRSVTKSLRALFMAFSVMLEVYLEEIFHVST